MTDTSRHLQIFRVALAAATTPEAAFEALCMLTQATVGAKLFTIMSVDMAAGLARRNFSNDPVSYPTSGTKPVQHNSWFDIIHVRGEIFVANTLAEIADVFPDHAVIGGLGCGSVVNLPIVLGGSLVATMNILHEEHYYTDARVDTVREDLSLPCMATLAVARALEGDMDRGILQG
ncbi:GAF domain-containing protein [Tropicimonas sp. TH_r6]|uniref:GAF domain-containing protein n=1 Tax=Tropicimonas sp. TH_r6 TaxID=3082085 RepID=UPI0029536A3B|nr:GAF domain-containing protein [Tropicimonas sp. TH_r6]MDV7141099.1 GAF domain-containing protein [Tropicimonas sp. TH_r6]